VSVPNSEDFRSGHRNTGLDIASFDKRGPGGGEAGSIYGDVCEDAREGCIAGFEHDRRGFMSG